MDIFKVAIIGIIGAILSVMLYNYKREFSIVSALATGIVILMCAFSSLSEVFLHIYDIAERYGVNTSYIGAVIKIIAIAYIGSFSSQLCRDSGQGAIAIKIEFCAKVLILLYSMPIADALLSLVVSILQ